VLCRLFFVLLFLTLCCFSFAINGFWLTLCCLQTLKYIFFLLVSIQNKKCWSKLRFKWKSSDNCKYYYMYIDNFNLQLQLPLIELRSPFSPFVPGGPCGPTRPCGPCWPCKPSFPLRPRFPGGPELPTGPRSPGKIANYDK